MANYFGESTVWTTLIIQVRWYEGSGDKVNVTKEAKAIFRDIMGTDETLWFSMEFTSIVRGGAN